MANAIDPLDIGALERSVNDSAGRISGIWLSFVAFSAYLAASASMISHRQIFLEEPIKLPTINIDLPLVASAIVLPLLFVIYHIFVLLQVVLLARTADAYNEAIEHGVADPADRIRVRQRLANTLFAQLFAGSPRERKGVLGFLLRLMAWITLAIAPVGVLIIFEIKFLPYHSAAVTWTHRGLIALDLLAVLLLWEGAVQPRRDITWRSLRRRRTIAIGAAVIFILSNVLITFPGEIGRSWMAVLPNPSSDDIPECQLPSSVDTFLPAGFDRIVLPGEILVDNDKIQKIISAATTNGQQPYESERTRILRNRDLRCARLAATDLRYVDLSGADLSGVTVRGAHLDGALLPGARLAGAILDGAQLQGSWFARRTVAGTAFDPASLPRSSLQGTQLRQAVLDDVDLDAADLKWGQLQDAQLRRVSLRGASFEQADLSGAIMERAKLQGVSFEQALMQGASFDSAEMQGASLTAANMQGASLNNATMPGAHFYSTQLQGATFHRSNLKGALFRDVRFEGATFVEAQLQGVQIEPAPGAEYVVVDHSLLWRTGGFRCNHLHVVDSSLEAIIEVRDQIGRNGTTAEAVPATDQEIDEFIKRSLADVPDKSRFLEEWSKDKLGEDLQKRFRPPSSDDWTPVAKAWMTCASESQARTTQGFQEFATYFTKYVCHLSGDPNPFVTGFLRGWTSAELAEIPVAKQLAKSLLASNNEQCPPARGFNDDTKKRLQSVAQDE
jgi:uncharacterized protein YjbI with pentapeptide repeats